MSPITAVKALSEVARKISASDNRAAAVSSGNAVANWVGGQRGASAVMGTRPGPVSNTVPSVHSHRPGTVNSSSSMPDAMAGSVGETGWELRGGGGGGGGPGKAAVQLQQLQQQQQQQHQQHQQPQPHHHRELGEHMENMGRLWERLCLAGVDFGAVSTVSRWVEECGDMKVWMWLRMGLCVSGQGCVHIFSLQLGYSGGD
jgi:hypothetical protein